MQSKLKLDHQTQAVAMATGGAAIAAIVAMFIPTGIWETLTGATGVSEMIPATGAPLGDKARALISFTFGALTLAILTVMLLRKGASEQHTAIAQTEAEPEWSEPEPEPEPELEPELQPEPEPAEPLFEAVEEKVESDSLFARLRTRIAAFAEARRGAGDITDLEDLPKLRSGDAHPDAPPRRPFSANRDLAEPEMIEAVAETVIVEQVEVETEWVDPVTVEVEEAREVETLVETPAAAATVAAPAAVPVAEISSLDDMVSRFESALAERDTQLAHIENLAGELQSSNVQPIRRDMEAPMVAEPMQVEQAALRAVEVPEIPADAPQKPESEELDAALRSALETLHRMNARTR